MFSAHYLNYLSQSFHISHADWSWGEHVLYWFGFTRLKVKVTRDLFCKKMVSAHYLRSIYHRAFIFHMLIGLNRDMTPIELIRSEVKVRGITLKNGFRSFSWELFFTKRSYIMCWLLLLNEDKNPIDFGFTRSKVKVVWVTFVINYLNSFYRTS